MADVAQRTGALAMRAADMNYSHERSKHRSRSSRANDESDQRRAAARQNPVNHSSQMQRHQHDPSNNYPEYSMDIIVQPPTRARVGYVLQPAITVRLRTFQPVSGEYFDVSELSNLLVMASLTTDAEPNSSERLQNLLTGRRFESLHPFSGDEMAQNGSFGLGYASFPDLVVREEGTYRLRITLIRMQGAGASGPQHGGNVELEVVSNSVKVTASA